MNRLEAYAFPYGLWLPLPSGGSWNWIRSGGGLPRKGSVEDPVVDSRFGTGASSSLRVKSMTSSRGRFLDVDVGTAGVETSRVKLTGGGLDIDGVAEYRGCEKSSSWISTRSPSSSSSSSGGRDLALLLSSFFSSSTISCHRPSGSIVTCSISADVFFTMSSTYSSRINVSHGRERLHMGHVHVGACSCNCR